MPSRNLRVSLILQHVVGDVGIDVRVSILQAQPVLERVLDTIELATDVVVDAANQIENSFVEAKTV